MHSTCKRRMLHNYDKAGSETLQGFDFRDDKDTLCVDDGGGLGLASLSCTAGVPPAASWPGLHAQAYHSEDQHQGSRATLRVSPRVWSSSFFVSKGAPSRVRPRAGRVWLSTEVAQVSSGVLCGFHRSSVRHSVQLDATNVQATTMGGEYIAWNAFRIELLGHGAQNNALVLHAVHAPRLLGRPQCAQPPQLSRTRISSDSPL
mmetsp:Transcript_56653/g.126543  ORF Transcript_56653/g.126543 Transcript_56653/m.126543 type:complete len:203 (-) Transcript_56653:16-624(-)